MASSDKPDGLSEQAWGRFEHVLQRASPPRPLAPPLAPEPPSRPVLRREGAMDPAPPVGEFPDQSRGSASRKPHYWGHRQRLRERFAAGGADPMPDYEIVEMLLFNAVPKIDVKPLAKRLLEDFGGFERLLTASREELLRHPMVDGWIVHNIKLAETIAIRLAKVRLTEKPIIGGTRAAVDYCRARLAHQRVEHLWALFVDKQHRLVADELQGRGTIDHAPAYPREITKRALELNASGVILVHNHPSGDPTPSRDDIRVTAVINAALKTVGILLLDHIIIGAEEEVSLAALDALS